MKIIILTDLHERTFNELVPVNIWKTCNLILSAGDIKDYSFPLDIVGVYGNHDNLEEVFKHNKLIDVHLKVRTIKDLKIGGIQGVYAPKNPRRWYHFQINKVKEYLNSIKPYELTFFITHERAYGIFDTIKNKNTGLKFLREFIEKKSPKFYISGHIRNKQGIMKIKDTICINPGHGINYEYAILDLSNNLIEFYIADVLRSILSLNTIPRFNQR